MAVRYGTAVAFDDDQHSDLPLEILNTTVSVLGSGGRVSGFARPSSLNGTWGLTRPTVMMR